MAEALPYMQAYGYITKTLDAIKRAQTPERFTNDFLASKLMVKASGARPFIAFAKRLGFLNQDGSPTESYKAFRSADGATSGRAVALAMRRGYAGLFAANEGAHELDKKSLEGLVVQVTGLARGSAMAKNIAASFEALKQYADFDAALEDEGEAAAEDVAPPDSTPKEQAPIRGIALSYQINLVLPKTDDIAVFNSIFRSLRDNLLRQ